MVSVCCNTPDCPYFVGDPLAFNYTSADSHAAAEEDGAQCVDGLLVPLWGPVDHLSAGDRFARATIYFLSLCYLFVGVAIIADKFMAAIEVITSQEKEITVKTKNNTSHIIVVRVWNETVANLTLMALGSSAPEIMLSVIEIYAKNFVAGDLGPGTIVGSAAFNLFIIIGLCVYVIPDGEVRKIKHLRVFFITATWSVFAYIWLYFILTWSSYGEVEIWEGVLTFMFFPATVITAYVADKRLLFYKYLAKDYRLNKRGVVVEMEGGFDPSDPKLKEFDEEAEDEKVREFEQHRRDYIVMLRELRQKHPNLPMQDLENLAREELVNKGPKSRAYYRLQATKKLTGKKIHQHVEDGASDATAIDRPGDIDRGAGPSLVFFDPGHYTVMESVGSFNVTVSREVGDLSHILLVDFETEDGSANSGTDYEYSKGTIRFMPGERHKQIAISVIDDDVFEEDEHFYIKLSNLRIETPGGIPIKDPRIAKLETPAIATVMILDDDHCGIFNLPEKDIEIVENTGECEVKVVRWSGARGRVGITYKTIEGTAKPGKDYEETVGEVIFENEEVEKVISIPIIEEDSYEKDVLFYLEISDPRQLSATDNVELTPEEESVAKLGAPRLGDNIVCQIRVKESKEFKNTVDKLLQKANASLLVGTSSWKEQFSEALTVAEDDSEDLPTCTDYVVHFLTLFWKLLFAFVPPTDYYDGWLCFSVAIVWIGVLTAFIGDLAGHFGCAIGLADSVTAISFVALGTSIPDTFASKVAAIQDKYADASVGNVTGSNAVNVFLGIGIAWSWAAIVHALRGETFCVKPGTLAFSVTLFCSGAGVAIFVLLLRRNKAVGGELGGPSKYKIPTTILFVGLWLFYLLMSSLEAYGYIQGF